ncbi:hypothetical protein [Streptomyces incanus]|uniref:Uncharacterized protein n=1 Tax=Streptomyces incanus TaxID=887453 RepID=A0ABW0XF87_9ACTN
MHHALSNRQTGPDGFQARGPQAVEGENAAAASRANTDKGGPGCLPGTIVTRQESRRTGLRPVT